MADDTALGAVVVGTGFGVLTHLRALRGAGFDVKALVGRDPGKTKEKAAMCGVPDACTSLAEALALPGVDAVAIATPPSTHAALAIEAVGAGKHVLCEKPFAMSAAEGRTMLDAAEAAGVVHLLGTEWRFGPGQALLTRALRQGVIGEPRLAVLALHIPTLADAAAEVPAWWEDAEQGGGWLGAYGSHIVDQIRSSLGEFEGVSASLQTIAPRATPMTADDTYTVQFRLHNGVEGVMHSSCASSGQFVAVTKVTGTGGSAWLQGEDVWIDDGSGPRQLNPPADLPNVAPVPPPGELIRTAYDGWHSMGIDLAPYTRVCEVLRDRILGRAVADDPEAATFADGVAGQAVLDAIRQSAASRSYVTIEAIDRGDG